MRVLFIIPCYNAEKNIEILAESLISQDSEMWDAIIIDDMSNDKTYDVASRFRKDKFTIIKNKEKKYALRNIVETSRQFEDLDDIIIATIDGDDSLCNIKTVSLLLDAYSKGHDVVWTSHVWDINGLNISSSSYSPYLLTTGRSQGFTGT